MAWDPTDLEAWQRTFETSISSSPATSSTPGKKLSISESNVDYDHHDAPKDYDDHIDPALKAASLNQGFQSTSVPSLPKYGGLSSQADTTNALSIPDTKALQDYVNGNDSPAPRSRSTKNGKRGTGAKDLSRKRRADDAFDEHSTSNNVPPASSIHKQHRPSPRSALRSSAPASKSPSAPPFSPITTTQQPIVVGDVMITSSAASARPFVSSPAPPRRSSSIVTSDLPDRVHDINDTDSAHARAVRNNPYMSSLIPQTRVQDAPQSSSEARRQFKQALLYHRARLRSTAGHARTGLHKILADLKKRYETQVKLCEVSGLTACDETWAEVSEITENQRPGASTLYHDPDGLTNDRLEKYDVEIARWDKAVGQSAILRKRFFYEEQISILEGMIESASGTGAGGEGVETVTRGLSKEGARQLELRRKAQKIKIGRRFAGLIEKD